MRSLSLVVAFATGLPACTPPRPAATHRPVSAPMPAAAAVPTFPEPNRDHLGPPDPIVVGSVARARDAELQFCYLDGVKQHPELAGRLTVHVRIACNGRVSDAAAASRSLDHIEGQEVEACGLNRISRWRFDESAEKTAVYPLILLFSR